MTKKVFKKEFLNVADKHLKYIDGSLNFSGVAMVMYPLNSIILMQKTLLEEMEEKKVMDFLYYWGFFQSNSAVKFFYNKFGFKPSRKTAQFLDEQGKFIGIGDVQYVVFNIKEKHFIWKYPNIPFSREYRRFFGIQKKPVDHFVRGLVAGACCAHAGDDSLIAIETQCAATGKPYCLFEVKEAKKWKGIRSALKNQIPQKKLSKDLFKKMGSTLSFMMKR